MNSKFLALIGVALVTGCGTVNNALVEKNKQVEYYRIFDIKTKADRHAVAKSASAGLGKNVSSASEAMPIPSFSTPPSAPGRFKITNPLQGSPLAALANQGGSLGMKMATCEDAIWTSNAVKNVNNSFSLNMTSCLFQYAEGYHLNLYAQFSKQEGGVMQISRSMANAMVGTPEEWVEKTFLDVIRTIRHDTEADVNLVEGYPPVQGTPWLDSGERITQK